MDVAELLLENQLPQKDMDHIHRSMDDMKNYLADLKRDQKAKGKALSLNIIFRIVHKDDTNKICHIELIGFPGYLFILFNPYMCKQKFNICFHCADISFNTEEGYFYFAAVTKIKPLFFNQAHFLGLNNNCTSDTFDRVNNVSFKGYYRNNMVLFDNIQDFNEKSDFGKLQGIILKIQPVKDCIVLKLLDPRNMLDTMKVYVNFRAHEGLDKYKNSFAVGQLAVFETNVKQLISKTMEVVFSVTYNSLSKISLIPISNLNLDEKLRTRNLILNNINKAEMCSTEVVNILPYVFHRGICKLILKLIKLYFVDIKLFCSKCSQKNNKCACLDPRFDKLNVFCAFLVKNSDLMMYATLKNQKDFYAFFDFSDEEKGFIIDYLNKYGDIKYTVGEFVDFSSKKATLLAILEKLSGYKVTYGKFVAKVRSAKNQENSTMLFNVLKNKDAIIYPNGSIKPNTTRNTINFVFDFKIKHVEENTQKVCEERFSYLKSKLLV